MTYASGERPEVGDTVRFTSDPTRMRIRIARMAKSGDPRFIRLLGDAKRKYPVGWLTLVERKGGCDE